MSASEDFHNNDMFTIRTSSLDKEICDENLRPRVCVREALRWGGDGEAVQPEK